MSNRVGNFSSSELWKLMTTGKQVEGFGAPAITYISEKKMEQRLGRQLNNENSAKPTAWGTFVEKRVFDLLGFDYLLKSSERLVHPTIQRWTGSPDCLTADTVCDIKSPFTLKSFCESVDAMQEGWERFKEVRPEYYYQLLSNGILTGKKYAEIIIYVPYKEELQIIREMANNIDGLLQNKVAFINWAEDSELPYLIKDEYYTNINILKFELLDSEKEKLTETVKKAIKLL